MLARLSRFVRDLFSPVTPDRRVQLLRMLAKGPKFSSELAEPFGGVADAQGWFFPTLRSLRSDRLIESIETDPVPQTGNRPRYLHRITQAGRAELAAVEAAGQ